MSGLGIAREIKQPKRISAILLGLAQLNAELGKLELAEKYFDEGLSLAKEIQQPYLVALALITGGEIYLGYQNAEVASQKFQDAKQIAEDGKFEEIKAEALYGLAQAELIMGHVAIAVEYGQLSLGIFVSLQHNKTSTIEKWLFDVSK